jgi:hypothetical protein
VFGGVVFVTYETMGNGLASGNAPELEKIGFKVDDG